MYKRQKNYYQSLALNCELSYFIYKDFQDAGELYLALEPDYDGFLVSGPVPRAAICQRVPSLPKPLISFGSSPLCYYESFFQIQYNEKDFYLERGYYDLMEWYSGEPDRPLYDFLKRGEFHDLIMEIYQNTSSYSLEQLCEMEEKIANHACMNERFFLEFHMARSNIEMQRKRNRDGVLNSYLSFMSHSYIPMSRHINVCIVIIYHNCPKTAIIFGNLSKILPRFFSVFRLYPLFSDRTGQRKSEDPNNDSRFLFALSLIHI